MPFGLEKERGKRERRKDKESSINRVGTKLEF
jgi:hypothetical protein